MTGSSDFGTKYSGFSYSRPNKDSEIVVPYDWYVIYISNSSFLPKHVRADWYIINLGSERHTTPVNLEKLPHC